MKAKRLSIINIGALADVNIGIEKPLVLFYGEVRQGKTTILNAVRWVMGGSYPGDIIRHGEQEASICFEFEGGSISRSWYRAKDGTIKDRPIHFIRDGKPVSKPATEIKKFLNPFLLDQDHLRNMSDPERKRYMLDLFGVDTADLDAKQVALEKEASELRATIKGYGDIDITPVEQIDVAAVKDEKQSIPTPRHRRCRSTQTHRLCKIRPHSTRKSAKRQPNRCAMMPIRTA